MNPLSLPEVFSDVRIADFTHAGVGPLTTMYLANAGAECIKVETSTRTEVIRRGGPFIKSVPDVEGSAHFAAYNLNKLCATINLKEPRGIELAHRLILVSDIVADSFTPGVMDKLGLGYRDLVGVKPDIIQISMSLAGKTGPHARYRGHGNVLAALAGLSHLTGWPDREPMAAGTAYTDFFVPHLWALSLVAALTYRKRTGRGQFIDASDYEAATDLSDTTLVDFAVNGRARSRQGNRHDWAAPHGVYPCRGEDRWVAIAVHNDAEWERFKAALGNSAWADEERFATVLARRAHQDELDELIGAWTRERDPRTVMEQLQAHRVEAGAVLDNREVHTDAQLVHREHFWEREDDPLHEWTTYDQQAYRLSKAPLRMKRPFPHLGQHNDYIFSEVLGLADDEFVGLVAAGVIL